MIDISSKIKNAFHSRMIGDIAATGDILASIQANLALAEPINGAQVDRLLADAVVDKRTAADLFALLASMERRTGTLAGSDELLAACAKLGAVDYQYYFQSGLNALVKSERMQALHFFRLAQDASRDATERLFAEFNTLIAAEDIGLPYEAQLTKFRETHAAILNDLQVSTVRSQVLAMQARVYYRNGDFEALARLAAEPDLGDQTTYYLAWALSIPYVAIDGKAATVDALTSTISSLSTKAFLGEFHLQTLLGLNSQLSPGTVVKITEKIERLYLWTWRWLMKPQAALLRPIVLLAYDILRERDGILSKDDFLQLRSSLRWLALFGGVDGTLLDQMNIFTPTLSSQKMPELEFEDLLLNKLFLFRDKLDQSAEIQLHWQQVMDADGKLGCWLRQLLAQEVRSDLAHSILELARSREPLIEGVVVDAVAGTLQSFRSAREVVKLQNAPAAALVQCLVQKDSINLDRAVQVAFGYQSFNEDRHGQRLAKILSKINTSFPGYLKCSRRGDMLVLSDRAVPILLRYTSAHAAQAVSLRVLSKEYVERADALHHTVAKKMPTVPALAQALDAKLTRGDIEQLLGCSKTKAVIQINELLERKLLTRVGSGRYVHYLATPEFYEELN